MQIQSESISCTPCCRAIVATLLHRPAFSASHGVRFARRFAHQLSSLLKELSRTASDRAIPLGSTSHASANNLLRTAKKFSIGRHRSDGVHGWRRTMNCAPSVSQLSDHRHPDTRTVAMKPDLDMGSLPAAYVNAEIRRTGAALLVSHLVMQLRARGLTLGSIVWNDGQGAHDRHAWHTFRICAGTASATLRVSDEELLAHISDNRMERTPIGTLVRDVLDELAHAASAVEAA